MKTKKKLEIRYIYTLYLQLGHFAHEQWKIIMFVYVDASVMNNERSSKGFFYAWMTLKITNHTFDIVFEANNYDV